MLQIWREALCRGARGVSNCPDMLLMFVMGLCRCALFSCHGEVARRVICHFLLLPLDLGGVGERSVQYVR